MDMTKTWWQSKTIWGGLIAVAAAVMKASGADLSLSDQNGIADAIINLSGAIGGILAIYGRLSARGTIAPG